MTGFLAKAGRTGESIDAAKRAIALRPDFEKAHYHLGTLYLTAARFPEAIEAFRTAIRLNPGRAFAHNQLGLALMFQGENDESIDSIIEAIQLEPGSEPFKNALLIALFSSGRITAAGLAHGACSDAGCVITVLLEKDTQLREILEKDGPETAQVPALVSEIYDKFSRSGYAMALNRHHGDAELRAVWDEQREEIARRLALATVRLIQIRKDSEKHPGANEEELRAVAAGILRELSEGGDFAALAQQHSEGWAEGGTETVTYGKFPEYLNSAAFSLEEGGFTRNLIEDGHSFYILKVESRQAGHVEGFDDPKAQATIKAVLAAQWRGDWERRYLARLQDKKPDLLMARMQNMAAAYLMADGDFTKAEKLVEQAFAMQRAELGAEAPKTLDTMGNLAVCRLKLGQSDEALKMLVELLALRHKVSGPEHPDTLTVMGNLGICHFEAGRWGDGIELLEQLLSRSRKVHGPEHSQTLAAMNLLGMFYFQAGRREDALKLKEEFEEILRKVNGQRQIPNPAATTTNSEPAVVTDETLRLQ